MVERQTYRPVQRAPFSVALRIKMAIWGAVNGTLYRFSPGICRGFRRSLVRWFGGRIANGASLSNRSRIDCPWNLTMGHQSSIGEGCWVYALDRIEIGAMSCIGQDVHLLTGSHDYTDPTFPLVTRPIVVGKGCWVAARSTVLPGVRVGDFSVVGAGSLVSKDLPSGVVSAGNPCRPIGVRKFRS